MSISGISRWHFARDRRLTFLEEPAIGALSALNPAFVAQVSNPLVYAGGLVPMFTGFSAFKTAGIDLVTSAKEIAE